MGRTAKSRDYKRRRAAPCAVDSADAGVVGGSRRVTPQVIKAEIGQRREVSGLKDHRRRDVGIKRLLPARRAKTPPVPRPQTREAVVGGRCDQVVAARQRESQELVGDHRADDMQADIARAGAAAAVTKEAGDRIEATGLEFAPEDIGLAAGLR